MNKIHLSGYLTLLALLSACKKDTILPPEPQTNYSSSIVIGGEGTTTTDLSTTTITELDVNADGINDFGFYGGYIPGGALSYIYGARIQPLHLNASILFHIPSDSLFNGILNRIEGSPPSVYNYTYEYTGPENKPGTSLHHVENNPIADYKAPGDHFLATSMYSNESVTLEHHHIAEYFSIDTVRADTTYFVGFYSEALGDYYGNAPFRYVGFKIIEPSGLARLGWIKLRVLNYYQIQVLQVGIQNPL